MSDYVQLEQRLREETWSANDEENVMQWWDKIRAECLVDEGSMPRDMFEALLCNIDERRHALNREAADALASLRREVEEAKRYLIYNVLEPNKATPLPTLIGICTQVDHLTATLPIGSRLRREVLEALRPLADAANTLDMDGIDGFPFDDPGEVLWAGEGGFITVADFRRAQALVNDLSSVVRGEDER